MIDRTKFTLGYRLINIVDKIFDYSIIDLDDDMEGEFYEETCLREVERIESNERYDVVTMEEIIFALPEMDEEIWEEKTQNHY